MDRPLDLTDVQDVEIRELVTRLIDAVKKKSGTATVCLHGIFTADKVVVIGNVDSEMVDFVSDSFLMSLRASKYKASQKKTA